MIARLGWAAVAGGLLLSSSVSLVQAQTHVTEIKVATAPVAAAALPAARVGVITVSPQAGPSIKGAFRFDAGTPFLDDCYDLRWVNVVAAYTVGGVPQDADMDMNPDAPLVGELPAIHPQIGQAVAGALPSGVGDNKPWYYNEQNWTLNSPAGIHVEGVGGDFVLAPGAQAADVVVTYHTWLVADDKSAGDFADQELLVLGGFAWTYTQGAPSSVAWTADLPADAAAVTEIQGAIGNASPAFPSPTGAVPSGAPWTPVLGLTLHDCSECPVGDTNEPDDTCAAAVVVTPGVHGNRSVGFGNDDFLRVNGVPGGSEIRVDLRHRSAVGDVDLFLFDPSDCTTPLKFSISATDAEHVDFPNPGGTPRDFIVMVRMSANSPNVTCNDYLLRIQVVPISIATFCPGDGSNIPCPCGNNSIVGDKVGCLNSINRGGGLTATGDPVLGADTVVLMGSGMPNGPVLYFQGTAQVNGGVGVFFGDGLRCVAGSVVRLGIKFNAAGMSTLGGGMDGPLSVKGMVTGPGTRHYQGWYRDAVTFCTPSVFNLTNGVTINWRL